MIFRGARGGRLALFAIALVLAACSGPPPTPTSSPAASSAASPTLAVIGACVLVPDMDSIVGQTTVGPPAGYTINDVDRCIWTYAADPARYVTLSVTVAQAHQDAIAALGEGEAVADLGDDAIWWPSNRSLSVLAGPNVIQVGLELDEADVSKDLAVSIAQAALQNLT